MKAILFPLILSVAAAGGVFAADFARGMGGGSADAQAQKTDGHDKAAKKAGGHDKKAAKGGHGKEVSYDSDDTEFLRFKRQFVVPVVENQNIKSLVLLNIALEVPANKQEDMFRLEPRFRDAFIRELLNLSDTGYFNSSLTSPDTYEAMRESLLRSAKTVSKDGVLDVLILDLTRQDS